MKHNVKSQGSNQGGAAPLPLFKFLKFSQPFDNPGVSIGQVVTMKNFSLPLVKFWSLLLVTAWPTLGQSQFTVSVMAASSTNAILTIFLSPRLVEQARKEAIR